jgi:Flp pilus assembly protein TadD
VERVAPLRTRGQAQLVDGDAGGAVATFRRALAVAPHDADLWNDLGLAYQAAGALDSAQTSFEQSILAAPRRAPGHLNLAVLLMRRGVSGRARSEFSQAIEAEPQNPMLYWNFAAALIDVGKPEAARELLATALRLDPANGPAEAQLGRVETLAGHPQTAIAHFERAESLGVDSPAAAANHGLALLQAQRWQEAETVLERAVAGDSTLATAWNHLGVARLRQGELEAALAPLRTARRLAPRDEDLRLNLGSALVRLARYPEAVALLRSPPPERADLLALWGMALRGMGRREDALPLLRRAAERAPREPAILNNYGVLLAETGDVPAALAVWRQVLAIDAGNVTARENLRARGGADPEEEDDGSQSRP